MRQRTSYVFVKLVCTIIISFGALSMFGWIFSMWLPPSMLPLLGSFNPNTASCFILAGVSLWLRNEKKAVITQTLIQLCSGLIFAASFLTLFEYSFNADFGIDNRLFLAMHNSGDSIYPRGRMSPF